MVAQVYNPLEYICSVCLKVTLSYKAQFRNELLWKAFADFIMLRSGTISFVPLAFNIELYQNISIIL